MAYLIKWILLYALKQGQHSNSKCNNCPKEEFITSWCRKKKYIFFFLHKNEIIINLYFTVQTHKSTALNAFCTQDPKTTGMGCKWYSMMWFFFLILWGRWYKSISTLLKTDGMTVWHFQLCMTEFLWRRFLGRPNTRTVELVRIHYLSVVRELDSSRSLANWSRTNRIII